MATAADTSYALSNAYRTQQNTLAAKVALLVALYYRQKVQVEDPAQVAAWLDLMVPRILAGSNQVASLAATYASASRAIELPTEPRLIFQPSVGAVEAQVRASLAVVGPADYMNKARQISTLDVPDTQKQALLADAKQVTADKLVAATSRHVANGGRQTIVDSTKTDQLALGYVRVTADKPCYFCAMLASRGLVFADDSFADSDPRFTGDGTAKVHDQCRCSMKAVYTRKDDKALANTEQFASMWNQWGKGQGADSVKLFRKGYDLWLHDGVVRPLSDFAS